MTVQRPHEMTLGMQWLDEVMVVKKKKILRKKLQAIKLLTERSVFSIADMCLRLCRQRHLLKRAG